MTNFDDTKKQLVFDFIHKNQGTTVNSISTALKGNVSDLTVRKKVKELVKDGEIEDRKTGNSFHVLHVSDRKFRNKILNELKCIDDVSSLMVEPFTKLHKMEQAAKSFEDDVNIKNYHINLVGPFFNSFFAMLHYLLYLSKSDPRISTTDAAELYYKIMELMDKIAYRPFQSSETTRILDRQKGELEIYRRNLHGRTDDTIGNIVLVDSLIKKIVRFKSQFLSST